MIFYYTFGTDKKFPYQNGWIEIAAPSQTEANDIFNQFYPPRDNNQQILNCAFVYTEEKFRKTAIFNQNKNHNHGCHAVYIKNKNNHITIVKKEDTPELTFLSLTEVKDAYADGTLYLYKNDDNVITAKISKPMTGFEGWFYFDPDESSTSIKEYEKSHTNDTIIAMIYTALMDLREISDTEYEYYACVIQEERQIKYKIIYDYVAIETTRNCNMKCKHCMRGNAQDKTISNKTIMQILDTAKEIGTITFTGGEPSLNINAMEFALNYAKQKELPIRNFYIITNGKIITKEFLSIIFQWYLYTSNYTNEPELSGLALSIDTFHEPIPKENVNILRGFSFFRGKDKYTDYNERYIINTGRAKAIDTPLKREPNLKKYIKPYEIDKENKTIWIDDYVYFTYNGDIIADCDLSYEDMETCKICSIHDENAFTNHLLYYKNM